MVLVKKNRMTLYKGICIILIISILSTMYFGCQAYAVQTPINHIEHSDNTTYNFGFDVHDIYASSSLGYMGAEWSSARQAWEFNYRFSGTGATRNSAGNSSNDIRIAAMSIEGTKNTSNMGFWTSTDDKYIGSAPESGSNPDYSDVATAVVGFAITAINNLGASYAWATVGLIAALCSTVDSQTTQDDYLWRQWQWSSDISDTGQFFWFLVDVEPNEVVEFSYNYMIFGPGYEILEAGEAGRKLTAPGPDSKSMVENWNPGMMSDEDKEKYGIEEITIEQIESRAKELYIPQERIDEFYKSGEEVIYFAHKLVEYETYVEPICEMSEMNDSEDLIKEINNQIKKSILIITAYSNIENKTKEDSYIIQKYEGRLVDLNKLLSEVQKVNDDTLFTIDEYRNELSAVLLNN